VRTTATQESAVRFRARVIAGVNSIVIGFLGVLGVLAANFRLFLMFFTVWLFRPISLR